MKVLLLHPEDKLLPAQSQGWDLIVDLGRAPAATYDAWSKRSGCRVVSLAQYARGFEDLYQLRRVIRQANNLVVDKFGIDWWDVVLPVLYSELERCFMLLGLAAELGDSAQIYSTRPDACVSALQKFSNVECRTLDRVSTGFVQKFLHYKKAFSRLDFDQLTQIAQDKFDSEHLIRRRFARKRAGKAQPLFLLPTAYINISRTAVSYAELLPEEKFLLVVARPGGRLTSLPANVQMISLDAYFSRSDKQELRDLTEKWDALRRQLISCTPEFRMADALGIPQRGPELMRWGIAVRDAWIRLFESENIVGCLSADDANPYTSLPLFIAAQQHIPALAVHHGALDLRMAFKTLRANFYLAKGELEQDYLLGACRMDPERIVMGGSSQVLARSSTSEDKPWLVFFAEPYGLGGWRMEEVYQDLLPSLCALARQCGLKLVFKLHPFESIKGHKNLLRKLLTRDQLSEIQWIDGPPTDELWNKTKFALTVESTIALECAIREIPIFLCAWLQSVYGGYLNQYAKFGAGHILNSSDEMLNIPQLLTNWKRPGSDVRKKIWQSIEPLVLHDLLTGNYAPKSDAPAQVGR